MKHHTTPDVAHVVVTDSRNRDGEILFLADRRLHSESYWTNEVKHALVFTNKERADRRVAILHHNNPRAMTLAGAIVVDEQQRAARNETASTN